MNILMMIIPKKDVIYLTTNQSIGRALITLKEARYSSVPLLDPQGFYVGTITEGDLLWYLENKTWDSVKEDKIKELPRNRDYAPVTINASMDDLIKTSLGQNFIPILDDRNFFIGIVTRKDLLMAYLNNNGKTDEDLSLNKVLNTIYKRRSIRRFSDESISDDVLETLSDIVLVSPTATNKTAQHSFLLKDRELIKNLSKLHQRSDQLANTPYLILILNNKDIESNSYCSISNGSGLVMSLLLAIESYDNLGGYWIGCRNEDQNKSILNYLQIPENYELINMVAFGVKAEFKDPNSRKNDGRSHTNKW